jgi:hypothetical protein
MGLKNLIDRLSGSQFFHDQLDSDSGPGNDRLAHHDRGIGLNEFVFHFG